MPRMDRPKLGLGNRPASWGVKFGAALSALDAEPLPAVAAAGTEVVPRPPPLDPRAALPEGGEKKAVAIF